LTANVVIISSRNFSPKFNDESPYYVSVLDVIFLVLPIELKSISFIQFLISKLVNPGTIIYDEIQIKDISLGQNGALKVICNSNVPENTDVKYTKFILDLSDLKNVKLTKIKKRQISRVNTLELNCKCSMLACTSVTYGYSENWTITRRKTL
jgi:hypothetical protein